MQIIISHMSALDFWRRIYPVSRTLGAASTRCDFVKIASSEEDIWTIAPEWVTREFLEPEKGVLHTLVFNRDQRRRGRTHRTHLWTAPVPPESFYDCGNGVFICSPAFAFVQMASSLKQAELIALAYELLGLYSFDKESPRGFRKRKTPLVTLEHMEQYLDRARELGVLGAAAAQFAVKRSLERSASPMETACSMLLSLPVRMGGYGLPSPSMNYPISTGEANPLCLSKKCFGDLCWIEKKVDLEYLGDYDHTGSDAMHADRGRTAALVELGYAVFEVTSRQVYSMDAFEAIALAIAKRLAKRVRTYALGPTPKRLELRQAIFNWNSAFGRSVKGGKS